MKKFSFVSQLAVLSLMFAAPLTVPAHADAGRPHLPSPRPTKKPFPVPHPGPFVTMTVFMGN
jgi:hypothetical protein